MAARYEGPESLRNGRVVACTGSSQDNFMHKNYPMAELLRVDNVLDVAMFVELGRADFGVIDLAPMLPILRSNSNLIIVDSCIYSNQMGVAFHKNNTALCSRFNAFLKEIEQNGVGAEMEKR